MSECHELCPSRMGYECICFEMRAQAWEEGYDNCFDLTTKPGDTYPYVNPYREGTD